MDLVTVIIPAKDEILLQATIDSALKASRGNIEIIAICDGYWPVPPVQDDPRVNIIHHTTAVGQRHAINEGAVLARGKYIFKVDAHCMFDEGFDVKLAQDCEYNWTVIPRMYVLDGDKWRPKWHKKSDFMFFTSPWADKLDIELFEHPLQVKYYDAKTARAFPDEYWAFKKSDWVKGDICDTMASVGAGFFMHKNRFLELGGLDEKHAHWGQVGVEIACKSWLSGGRQVVNKKTWFAHQWRRKPPWGLSQKAVDKSRNYSVKFWQSGDWPLQKYPLQWLADKFAPVPTWDKQVNQRAIDDFHKLYYRSWNRHPRTWMGIKHCKYPTDMMVHQQIIWENKPDVIIECGSYLGGGTLFFAHLLDCIGKGEVIGIDKRELKHREHPRITYITGRTTSTETLEQVRKIVGDKTCMVVLDSNHKRCYVKRELMHYSKVVTPGQFLVVEDTYLNGHPIKPEWGPGPLEAVEWFLARDRNFKQVPLENRNLLSQNAGGWLKKL